MCFLVSFCPGNIAGLASSQSHLNKFAVHSRLQMLNADAQHRCPKQISYFVVQYCSANHAGITLVSAQSHLCKFAVHSGLQMLNGDAHHYCPEQTACFLVQCCPVHHPDSALVSVYNHTCAS